MKNNNNSSTRGRGIVHGLISAAVVALLAAVYFVVEHNLRDVAVGLEEEFARGVDQSFLLSQLALRFERVNVDIHRAGAHAAALDGMDIRSVVQAQKDSRAVAREVHRIHPHGNPAGLRNQRANPSAIAPVIPVERVHRAVPREFPTHVIGFPTRTGIGSIPASKGRLSGSS